MTELTYPRFPVRALVAIAVALAALVPVAIALNAGGPSERACAIAAERIMAARGYPVALMELTGPGAVRACHGLSRQQYAQSLLATYLIEYGKHLPSVPLPREVPPPAFKALSARSAARSH